MKEILKTMMTLPDLSISQETESTVEMENMNKLVRLHGETMLRDSHIYMNDLLLSLTTLFLSPVNMPTYCLNNIDSSGRVRPD